LVMSLSIGIVGLPNVGKSTLFNALTGSNILAANYPFATIEPNTGIVPVPDERLQKLSELYGNAPVKPATVTFVDIAGLVAGASKGEGLGNQFLSHIRSCNAIVQVVRAFKDDNVTHVDEQHARANPKLKPVLDTLLRVRDILNDGKPLWSFDDIDPDHIADLQLITAKPIIYVFNVDEEGLSDDSLQQKLTGLAAPSTALFICAKLESELKDLDAEDGAELLESYGQKESGLLQLIHAAYGTLGLQSYLTAGDKEVRAWTIPQGATAPQAAGVIHGDFERGFIAAEIVGYNDLIAAGSLHAARSAGKVRTEGKTYIMHPNDVVEFRFNVSK
jgi:ribosome-binding ATPase YchF (GTP1/OBG family)